MDTGVVKILKDTGFGFIMSNAVADGDIFFHASDVIFLDYLELRAGDTVAFVLSSNEKGHVAKKIVLIQSGAAGLLPAAAPAVTAAA